METAAPLARFDYGLEGFQDTLSPRASPTTLSEASRNIIFDLDKTPRPFKGTTHIGVGARVMALAGDTWAGLADTTEQEAAGSIFSYFAEMLIYAGYGQIVYNGTAIPGRFASSLIQLLLRWQGSYTSANSGPFVAGLPAPSAPTVGLIDTALGGVPQMNGTYSWKVSWIRTTTFGRSVASPTSVTLFVSGKGVYLQVGEAPVGATHLIVWVTKKNFGGRGLHYRLVRANPVTGLEYTAKDIARQLTDVMVTNASAIVTSASGNFTVGDVGKRFAPESAGFSVPPATLVLSVNSPTQITLSNVVTVASGANPRTASIISFVGGYDRSVLLNWQESDLSDEDAWIEDYPPPPASHVFPLEKVIGVITDADSFDLASGTNRGTTACFSLRNLPESFNPLHRLYLPQKVVDVLHRGLDSYVFIGCKTFIGALQFIDIYDSAPATLSTILPNEGITSRNNWCARGDGLYLFTNKGVAKRILAGGGVDDIFSIPVRRFMKNWTDKTKVTVASYGDGNSVAYIYKNICLLYNTQLGLWSAPLYLSDYFAAIEAVSALDVGGRLLISARETSISPTVHQLFDFDTGTGGTVAAIPHYTDAPLGNRAKIINSITPIFNSDTNKSVYVSLHINDEIRMLNDVSIAALTNNLSSPSANFNQSFVGKYVLINGAGDAGALLRARIIGVTSASVLQLGTCERILSNCVPQNASLSVASAYCVFAHRIYKYSGIAKGINRPEVKEIFINGVNSYAVGIIMESDGTGSAPLSAEVDGTVIEKNWRI